MVSTCELNKLSHNELSELSYDEFMDILNRAVHKFCKLASVGTLPGMLGRVAGKLERGY